MDVIQLRPINSDVTSVGCLYNYNSAETLRGFSEIPSRNVDIELHNPLQKSQRIATDVSKKIEFSSVDSINRVKYLLHNDNGWPEDVWFGSCFRKKAESRCKRNNEVHITAYLKFVCRTESLKQDFIISNISKSYFNRHGGTHLIDKVEYGAEFLLWMYKMVDLSRETKETAEKNLHLALKAFLDGDFSASHPIVNELSHMVTCSFRSSIQQYINLSNGTFAQCYRLIVDAINIEKNDRRHFWRPITMRLRRIPSQVDIEIIRDLTSSATSELLELLSWVMVESHQLRKAPSLQRMPPLEKLMVEFQDVLKTPLITDKLVIAPEEIFLTTGFVSSFTDPYLMLLKEAMNWLDQWCKDMEKVDSLLKGNDLRVLDMSDIEEIKKGINRDSKLTKVFVVHSFVANGLEERFKSWATNPAKNLGLPVFVIERSDGNQRDKIYTEWQSFSKEARDSVDDDVDYCIGIMPPNSPYEEGSVFTISYEKTSVSALEALPVVSIVLASAEGSKITRQNRLDDDLNKNQNNKLIEATVEGDNKDNDSESEEEFTECVSAGTRILRSTGRVGLKHCRLLKVGKPSSFLLEAKLRSSSNDLRWFEIGAPRKKISSFPGDHKVIILMGASGCGKSTLIEGMVNYILGVCWMDWFRFKVIREEETVKWNQVYYSKTNSVTVYTIYHRTGMAVPYSITIIDTPGYGDAEGGIERDEKITATIGRFLTEQRIQMREIHAACFVANSGDSRLTPCQRYIVESMLSIFGGDIREKIQLLVTFAESADPPVVRLTLLMPVSPRY